MAPPLKPMKGAELRKAMGGAALHKAHRDATATFRVAKMMQLHDVALGS